ncbi:MAG: PEGA domain-containing protein [Calditrichia bacterium]
MKDFKDSNSKKLPQREDGSGNDSSISAGDVQKSLLVSGNNNSISINETSEHNFPDLEPEKNAKLILVRFLAVIAVLCVPLITYLLSENEGTLEILTNQNSVDVFLNESHKGIASPGKRLVLENLKSGSWSLRAEKEGYMSYIEEVIISSGQLTTKTAHLDKRPQVSSEKVDSTQSVAGSGYKQPQPKVIPQRLKAITVGFLVSNPMRDGRVFIDGKLASVPQNTILKELKLVDTKPHRIVVKTVTDSCVAEGPFEDGSTISMYCTK